MFWHLPQLWAAVDDMWTVLFLRDAWHKWKSCTSFMISFYVVHCICCKVKWPPKTAPKSLHQSEVQLKLTFCPNILKCLDLGCLIFLEMITQWNSITPEQLNLLAVFLCLVCLVSNKTPWGKDYTSLTGESLCCSLFQSIFGFIST